MHILRVAGIDDCDGVALDGVSVVPLVGVCHVASFPSADGGTATEGLVFTIIDRCIYNALRLGYLVVVLYLPSLIGASTIRSRQVC